jgi:pyruvate,water dikinase
MTTTRSTPVDHGWAPPGPGTWLRFRDHFPSPVTAEYAAVFCETLPAANATVAERYGIPMATIAAATVNGYVYISPVPLVAAGRSAPPGPLLWLAARLHPALRRCARAAARALDERPWRAVMDEWTGTIRPQWLERNAALQRIDPAGLDGPALAGHLEDCRQNWREGYRLHFDLHGSDMLPASIFLVRGAELGLDRDTMLAALTGWSPVSLGHDVLLAGLRTAVAGRPCPSLDAVRALGPEAATALDAYLDRHGWTMVTSYDLDGRALIELPDLLRARLTAAAPATTDDPRAAAERAADTLRAAVPAADRQELDRLLDDARLTYGLRDDNGSLCASWPVGLTRRALLVAGERLAATGKLHDSTHVVELRVAEVATLLRGTPGPSADAARALAQGRRQAAAADPPDALGDPLVFPDTGRLPRAMGLLSAAQLQQAADSGLGETAAPVTGLPAGAVEGVGIGDRQVVAVARVLHDAADALAELEPGEIIVTASTNPTWNAVLPLAAGLVVEEGGALSHAAILARELDLPAVVGARGATGVLRTGDVLVVDAAAGLVRPAG